MVAAMQPLPEAQALLTHPRGGTRSRAAVFLGSLGDPQAYESSRQVLKLAGLSLVEHSSGTHTGAVRISRSGRPLLRRQRLPARAAGGAQRRHLPRAVRGAGGQERGKKLPAVVAVGRRMLKLMFSIARSQRTYTPEPPGPQRAAA